MSQAPLINPELPEEEDDDDDDDEISDQELNRISQELQRVDPDLFKDIPENKRVEFLRKVSVSNSFIRLVESRSISHSGPLPRWEDLQKYDQIIPNGADRIMKMAEQQSGHRMQLENFAIKEQMGQSKSGQIFGFIIGIVAILAATACILMGHDSAGAVFGTGGIVGLVSVFVYGKYQQRKSVDEKN